MREDDLLEEITRRLSRVVPAESRVVLFGCRARGQYGDHSDVDVLVIEPEVEDRIRESVRLRQALNGLGVPIDVVVVPADEAQRRAAVRGTIVERALREGQILIDT